MNNWIESAQLGSALLKGSGLLLATSLLTLLLRRASATSQFRVCFVGIIMSLLVAVVSVAAPFFSLDFSIEHEQVFRVANKNSDTHGNPNAGEHMDQFVNASQHWPIAEATVDRIASATPGSDRSASTFCDSKPSHQAGNTVLTESNTVSRQMQFWMNSLLRWWPYVWGTGVAAILLQTLLPYLLAFRAFNQCEQLNDEAARQLTREMSQKLEIPVPKLLVCAESITPFVIGLWKPKIVLPSDAGKWPIQKMTFVLMHELSHIRRRDLLTQVIARVAVAVYWFHPLSWWSFSQMMRLRELACDDCVLLQEQNPGSYAEALLDVASSYRSTGQAFGIGMSGKIDITRRIHAALDASRARTSFSKSTSLGIAGLSLLLCLVLGAIQLRARAIEPQDETQTASNKQTKDAEQKGAVLAVDEHARSMTIKILDERLQPLEGVDVYVTGIDYERRGGNGNMPRIHYPTDASGQTVIKFRESTLRLQLWPNLEGYVPQYALFDEKKFALPNEYTFYFEKGERLAGKVVDASGKPIKDATIQVKTSGEVELNERAKKSSPLAQCSGWLAEDEKAAKTNADGEWEIRNAPSIARNPMLKFELLVGHPDFASDRNWGVYQNKQGIDSAQLRSGAAILVMDRGAILRGKITGPDGEPVTKGLVIWVSNPYFATGVNEAEIRSDGTFQLPSLEPGKYPITVLAPGFAPEQREVELSLRSVACDFQLERGNPIRIEIVDINGNPIPNASISFGREGWRGTNAIYNNDHSNVPDSGIPRRADDKGVYKWDWAPSDGVKYGIRKPGYDARSVTLVAKAEAHRIVLTSRMTISGTVVDAKSGKPIDDFKVIGN